MDTVKEAPREIWREDGPWQKVAYTSRMYYIPVPKMWLEFYALEQDGSFYVQVDRTAGTITVSGLKEREE